MGVFADYLARFVVIVYFIRADARKCLHCADMSYPYDCNLITECSSAELCFVEQSSSGRGFYNSGCLSKQLCDRLYPAGNALVGKREADFVKTCPRCCAEDYCNNHCNNGITATTSTTTILTPTKIQTKPSPTTTQTNPSTLSANALTCSHQGYMYDEPTRLCLKFYPRQHYNWTDAQNVCRVHHGRLVIMTSDSKKRDVNHVLATRQEYHGFKFWVGATAITHVHTFTWSDGRTIVVDDYENYDLTKTNCVLTGNPEPAVLYAPCRERNPFICENSNFIRP